jgi:hypothetical protein
VKGASRADKLALLADELARAQQAAAHFEWSVRRCEPLSTATTWSAEDLERLESMASRFARLSDLLTQRLMRLADELELESAGSLLDRLRRAEKRGWVDHDGDMVRIRELRNLVAHEYEDEDLLALYREILRLAPTLLDCVQRVAAWAKQLR